MKNLRRFGYILILVLPPTVVLLYAAFIVYITWPIQEFSFAKSGLFGDSFGILNALFSGLAFSVLIVTALLQREELKLQRLELKENREELKRTASAQELSARLNALTALFEEYRHLAQLKNEEYDRANSAPMAFQDASLALLQTIKKERDLVLSTKYRIFTELKKMAGLREDCTQQGAQANAPALSDEPTA